VRANCRSHLVRVRRKDKARQRLASARTGAGVGLTQRER
jgi:hypothetical protein